MADPTIDQERAVRELVERAVDATLLRPATEPPPVPSSAAAGPPPRAQASPDAAVTIAVGADHGGFALKQVIAKALAERGFAVTDCGTDGPESVDYPDFAHAVARLVAAGTCRWGIVVDGAGIGSAMVANKVPGVRAACCHDISMARNSREHNHANVLTLGARMIGEGLAMDIVTAWLATDWGQGRHAARVEKIAAVELQYGPPTAGATR